MGVPVRTVGRPGLRLSVLRASAVTWELAGQPDLRQGRLARPRRWEKGPGRQVPAAVWERVGPAPLRGGGCGSAFGCRCRCCRCCCYRRGAVPRTDRVRSLSPSRGLCSPSTCSTPAAWPPTIAGTTSGPCATWKRRYAATGACGRSARAAPATAPPAARSCPSGPGPEPSCPSSAPCWSGRAAPVAARPSASGDPRPATASARMCAATSTAECPTTTCSEPTSRYPERTPKALCGPRCSLEPFSLFLSLGQTGSPLTFLSRVCASRYLVARAPEPTVDETEQVFIQLFSKSSVLMKWRIKYPDSVTL